jgi:hypothetical protein
VKRDLEGNLHAFTLAGGGRVGLSYVKGMDREDFAALEQRQRELGRRAQALLGVRRGAEPAEHTLDIQAGGANRGNVRRAADENDVFACATARGSSERVLGDSGR